MNASILSKNVFSLQIGWIKGLKLQWLICIVTVFTNNTNGLCQNLSNVREKQVSLVQDTVRLDSMSIAPNSLVIKTVGGELIPDSMFIIDLAKGWMIWRNKKLVKPSVCHVSYRALPYYLPFQLSNKDHSLIEPDLAGRTNPFIYNFKNESPDVFAMGGMSKSGSISRGITFGNSQDVMVNSSLDLKLSGYINDSIKILAAITDDNIPIQPEGNTQQIQDFDKVYIKLFNSNASLVAGDFEIQPKANYFMKFYKKVQGLDFSHQFKFERESKPGMVKGVVGGSLAVSKGKFSRNIFNGIEGNQGPYKLTGAENESYIIVLSGTEKVYIDGQLLSRGHHYDYIIDYNTAEVTFTPNQLITKDKRIVVEFQYSDRNYTRSVLNTYSSWQTSRLAVGCNIYSEQDIKSQPLDQELSDDQKQLLSEIGDDLNSAISYQIDSVGNQDIGVLYEKLDSLGYEIYKYAPLSGSYQVSFSFVGQGKGNYIRDESAVANGRVFQWVAPNGSGTPQGDYAPIVLLVTPKKKQMVAFDGNYKISNSSNAYFDLALSNNDVNTYSTKDRHDDFGYAFKLGVRSKYALSNTKVNPWILWSDLNYEQVDRYFSPIERFRSVEFERDWNVKDLALNGNDYIPGIQLALKKKETGTVQYQLKSYIKGNDYQALINSAFIDIKKHGFRVHGNASVLQSESTLMESRFIRSKGSVSKQFKWLVVGISEEQEYNSIWQNASDSLLPSSFSFVELGGFVKSPDTVKNKYELTYKQRTDLLPLNGSLQSSSLGEVLEMKYELNRNPSSRLTGTVTYRTLEVLDSSISQNKPDESLLSRLEYRLKLWKGAVTLTTFYQMGSGMEVKKEFTYVRVADGQGIYEWIDRDSNDVETLDEFEIAAYQYNANYIRVNIPTNDYIKTYSNLFNESIYIRPDVVWRNKEGLKKVLSRFSNQTAYRVERKTVHNDYNQAYNPFLTNVVDSSLISLNSSFRNVLYFNRSHPVFGLDLKYIHLKGKSLMVNGLDSREHLMKSAYGRYNLNRELTLNMLYGEGIKANYSEFFSSKDYLITFNEWGPKLTYQPNTKFRLSATYNYKEKENTLEKLQTDSLGDTLNFSGGEFALLHKIGLEFKHNAISKGSLLIKANFIRIDFLDYQGNQATQNTTLGYEMLEGLQTGANFTWSLSYQQTLANNMQLNLTYDGKKSENSPATHRGGVQLRAFF